MKKYLNKCFNANAKTIIEISCGLLLMLMIVPLAGCSAGKSVLVGSSALTGIWDVTDRPQNTYDEFYGNFPIRLVLLEGGAGAINTTNTNPNSSSLSSVSWTTEKNMMLISYSGGTNGRAFLYNYSISGSTLTLVNINTGKAYNYNKLQR